MLFTQFPLIATLFNHSTFVKAKKNNISPLVLTKLQTLFGFCQPFH